jgi:hypothetical protein
MKIRFQLLKFRALVDSIPHSVATWFVFGSYSPMAASEIGPRALTPLSENQFHDGIDSHKESVLRNRYLWSIKVKKFGLWELMGWGWREPCQKIIYTLEDKPRIYVSTKFPTKGFCGKCMTFRGFWRLCRFRARICNLLRSVEVDSQPGKIDSWAAQ